MKRRISKVELDRKVKVRNDESVIEKMIPIVIRHVRHYIEADVNVGAIKLPQYYPVPSFSCHYV